MNKSTRLAVLLASTSIGTALPIAGWATTTCLDTDLSGWTTADDYSSDYSNNDLSPTTISTPNATTFVSGCVSKEGDSYDYLTFTGLNPGNNKFEFNLQVNNGVVRLGVPLIPVSMYFGGDGTNTSHTLEYNTGDFFSGGDYLFNFFFSNEGGYGWGAYTISLTEAPLAPVPLPATAGLLGLGLAGLGAVGRRKRAKVRG